MMMIDWHWGYTIINWHWADTIIPEIVLRSGAERLERLLLDGTAPLSESAKGDLKVILKELRRMQALLKPKRRVNEIEKRVRQIEELNYQIEDDIKSTKKIRSKMEAIIKQIEDIASKTANNHHPPQQITDPIGLEEDREELCQLLLLPPPTSVPVFAIYGVVGSGKTTLARLVYDHPDIAEWFAIRKWIDVPQEFEVGYIQKKMMEGLMRYSSSEKQFLEHFHNIFSSRRSLIVLDDVRSTEAVETLRRALPKLCQGSCIFITTRVGYIAEQFRSVHSMRPLNENDSWTLFDNVFSDCDASDSGMIAEMIGCCAGSPQLIKYLALYLKSKKENQEWETVQKNTRAFLSEFCCLVYNELPEHLQPCFMYLGHFLKDPSIDPEKLSHLWMIEGFLSSRQRARMDMTEQYLRELALQGMVKVQAEEVPTTKKFKACYFVQGMENFCISSCEEKGFLKIIDLRREDCSLSSSDEPRRLVIYLGQHKVDILPKVAKTIRSVRMVLENQQQIEGVCPTKMLKLKEFRVLRVLDFDGIDFPIPKLLADIFNLEFLRYLSFKECVLEELPSSISKLCHLRVLDLRVRNTTKIPNVLWKMRRLNHLYLPVKFATQNGEILQLDSLKELETLVNFNTRLCRATDVSALCKLHYLKAMVDENFSNFEAITNYMKTSALNNCPLQCSMDIMGLDCYAEERRTVLLGFLWCKVLVTLQFKGFIGLLPPYDEISQNLTELVLNNSYLKEDPMPILERLPSLGILILTDDAYSGKKMVCSALGFPQLKYLRLLNLSELKMLEIDILAMPILSDREINCPNLDTHNIPPLPRRAA